MSTFRTDREDPTKKWFPCVVEAVHDGFNALDMFVGCSPTHILFKRDSAVVHEKAVRFSLQNTLFSRDGSGDGRSFRFYVQGTNFSASVRMDSADDRHDFIIMVFKAKGELGAAPVWHACP